MWELRITGNTYKYVYTVFLALMDQIRAARGIGT